MSEEVVTTIWVVTEEMLQTPEAGAKGGGLDTGGSLFPPKQTEAVVEKRVAVPVEKLKREMNNFMQVVGELFSEAEQHSGMKLDEIELSVEVNGEGQVSRLGMGGVKTSSKGAIKLKFKRTDSK